MDRGGGKGQYSGEGRVQRSIQWGGEGAKVNTMQRSMQWVGEDQMGG